MSTIAAPGFRTTRAAVRRPARPAASSSRTVTSPAATSPAATSPAATSPAATSRSVRLTRRGRMVFLLGFVVLVLAIATVVGGQSAATDQPGTPVKTRTVEVASGDTLWEIASTVAAPGEVRDMVLQIQELNALSSPALAEGQEIEIPVG